jgi:hypothetical protein
MTIFSRFSEKYAVSSRGPRTILLVRLEDETAALREIDALIAWNTSGEIPELVSLKVLFAPAGPIQELSVRSGWGNEFLALADRFDAALSDIHT